MTKTARSYAILLVSQALASGGNFLALVLASRAGSGADFGAASLAFAVYALGGTLIRPFTGQVAQIALRSRDSEERGPKLHPHVLMGLALSSGTAVAGLVVALFGGRVPSDVRAVWLIVIGSIPVLLVYDLARYWLATLERSVLVAMIDGGWLVAMSAVYLATRPTTAVGTLAVWAGSGLLAAVAGISVVLRLSPARVADRSWTMTQVQTLGGPMVVEAGLIAATNWSLVLFAPYVVGLAELGRLQGFDLVFGPVTMLATGLGLAVQPKTTVLIASREPDRAWSHGVVAGSVLLAVAIVTFAIFTMWPGNALAEVFGLEAAGWLVAVAAFTRAVAQAPQLSATLLTRATRWFRPAIRTRIVALVVGAGGGMATMLLTRSLAMSYVVTYTALAAGSIHVLAGIRRGLDRQQTTCQTVGIPVDPV